MSTPYLYTVFGINIKSEFELDELIEGNAINQPVIEIVKDHIVKPEDNLEHTVYRKFTTFNESFFYLEVPKHAAFIVHQEEQRTVIKVDLFEGHDWAYAKSWMYGSVLTAALQYNDRFALHASAVLNKGELVLFCGNSGIGKSTIASQLHTKGYPLFSDDKCVLFCDPNNQHEFYVYPSLKITRLWENSINELEDDDFLHNPIKVALKANKFQYLIKDSEVINESKPIKSIYRIHNGNPESQLEIRQPLGMRKMKQLRNQTHRVGYLKGLGKQKSHWDFLVKVTEDVPFNVIVRPEGTTINEFVNFVQEKILNP